METTEGDIARSEKSADTDSQLDLVKKLIANKKKESTKAEASEFTQEWSKLSAQAGVNNETISLLIEGFSIAGAAPLFALMQTDEDSIYVLRKLKTLPVIMENNLGASLRIYVHLLSLAANAGRGRDCINMICSMIPKLTINKEGKPFGTNTSTISKYLVREVDAGKARASFEGAALPDRTARMLCQTFADAFEKAISKKKPIARETAAVKMMSEVLSTGATEEHEPAPSAEPEKETEQVRETPNTEQATEQEQKVPAETAPESAIEQAEDSSANKPESASAGPAELERALQKVADSERRQEALQNSIREIRSLLQHEREKNETLRISNTEKQEEIDSAERRIEALEEELKQAKAKSDAQSEMIGMLDKSREQKGSEALARIASKLKVDYADFNECSGEAMTVELGEIMRLQLGSVFDVLKSAGVKL
jgi:hypothetical protein